MSKKYTTNFLEDTNGSTGSANQVLVSTAAGIDWVDGSGSGIIGGPYLPLSAGSGFPLTGDLWLDDNLGASPSLYLQNGSDNYWRLVNGSTGIFSLKEGTSDRITILPGGNVGIGTTNPLAALQVNSITASAMSQVAGEAHIIGVNHDLSDTQMGTLNLTSTSRNTGASNQALGSSLTFSQNASKYVDGYEVVIGGIKTELMYTGNMNKSSIMNFYTHTNLGLTPKMSIDATGNVGIGTTSPSEKLHVEGDSTTTALISTPANSGVSQLRIAIDGGLQGGINLIADEDNSIAKIVTNNSSRWPLAFYVRGSDGTNERMRIASTGNVGIGTTNPTTPLQVVGIAQIATGSDTAFYEGASVRMFGSQSYTFRNSPGQTRAIINVETTGVNAGNLSLYNASTVLTTKLSNAGDSYLNGGNVGIGTSSPSEKLEVSGNVKAETLIATDLNDGYVPYSKSGTLGLQDSKIYTQGAGIGVGTTTLAAGCHITSLSNISATGYRVAAMQTAPSSRGDTGTLGEIRITADYIYVCYATDSWKRVAIAQW